jgi:hypothetical protein
VVAIHIILFCLDKIGRVIDYFVTDTFKVPFPNDTKEKPGMAYFLEYRNSV